MCDGCVTGVCEVMGCDGVWRGAVWWERGERREARGERRAHRSMPRLPSYLPWLYLLGSTHRSMPRLPSCTRSWKARPRLVKRPATE